MFKERQRETNPEFGQKPTSSASVRISLSFARFSVSPVRWKNIHFRHSQFRILTKCNGACKSLLDIFILERKNNKITEAKALICPEGVNILIRSEGAATSTAENYDRVDRGT